MKQGGGKNEIAHKHSHLIIISSIHASLSAALLTLINHIIMYQRSGMKKLQTYRRMLGNTGNLSKITCHQQDEYRAHTFSCALTDVVEHLGKEAIAMHKRLVEQIYKIC